MTWQRVESATIDPEVDEGLAARIADPLWMMARQWQVGEFRGEDAANPLLMRLTAESVEVDRWQVGPPGFDGAVFERGAGADETPLEAAVEAEPHAAGAGAARVAAESAHLLMQMLADVQGLTRPQLAEIAGRLREEFPFEAERDPDRRDVASGRRLAAFVRHSFDATAFGLELIADRKAADPFVAGLDETVAGRVVATMMAWIELLTDLFVIPRASGTWNPERMEYEFRVGAPIGTTGRGLTLASRDYGGGRLDWYSFDVVSSHDRKEPGRIRSHEAELLPTPLSYPGMPASRFWEQEDGEIYYGDIDAAPEDLARVTLAAYATVYGDDWYLVPLTLPAGRLVRVTAVEVLDDFGATTTVEPAAVIDGPDRAFKFFELTGDDFADNDSAPLLFVPPTVSSTDAGRPLDDVVLARDEASNLAWAVEHRIEGVYGRGIDPLVAAAGGGRRSAPPPPAVPEPDRQWTFDLGGDVPGNWIPLLPVRLGERGPMGLQRGRVPIPGTGATRGALSTLLEPHRRLVIEESELPAAGLRVARRYQSARTPDGGLRVWLGRQKGPGRPTGESGFVMDRLTRPED